MLKFTAKLLLKKRGEEKNVLPRKRILCFLCCLLKKKSLIENQESFVYTLRYLYSHPSLSVTANHSLPTIIKSQLGTLLFVELVSKEVFAIMDWNFFLLVLPIFDI